MLSKPFQSNRTLAVSCFYKLGELQEKARTLASALSPPENKPKPKKELPSQYDSQVEFERDEWMNSQEERGKNASYIETELRRIAERNNWNPVSARAVKAAIDRYRGAMHLPKAIRANGRPKKPEMKTGNSTG